MLLLVLTMATAAPVDAAPPPQTTKPKMICHREEVTGSLAGSRKICKSAEQWRSEADRSSGTAQRMQDAGLINSCAPDKPC